MSPLCATKRADHFGNRDSVARTISAIEQDLVDERAQNGREGILVHPREMPGRGVIVKERGIIIRAVWATPNRTHARRCRKPIKPNRAIWLRRDGRLRQVLRDGANKTLRAIQRNRRDRQGFITVPVGLRTICGKRIKLGAQTFVPPEEGRRAKRLARIQNGKCTLIRQRVLRIACHQDCRDKLTERRKN